MSQLVNYFFLVFPVTNSDVVLQGINQMFQEVEGQHRWNTYTKGVVLSPVIPSVVFFLYLLHSTQEWCWAGYPSNLVSYSCPSSGDGDSQTLHYSKQCYKFRQKCNTVT